LEQKYSVKLGEVEAVHPITQGLAELVAYFGIADRDEACRINGGEKCAASSKLKFRPMRWQTFGTS
jgi:hypothetical protein